MPNAPQPAATRRQLPPWLIGLIVEQIGVITALVGYFWRHGEVWQLVWALVGSSVVGALIWLFAARRLLFLFATLLAGFFAGVVSAWDLFITEPFQRQFFVAAITAAFYLGLGLAAGIITEFISYLHHLSHGRAPLDYPSRGPADKDI